MADYQNRKTPSRAQQAPAPQGKPPPRAPRDKREVVTDLIYRKMPGRLASLLGKNVDGQRFATVFLNVILQNPDLIKCTEQSLARAMAHSAEVDLEVGGAYPHAYLIPYYNKDLNADEAQFQISVWGYTELVRRAGVRKVWADVIYSNDVFEVQSGTAGKQLVHKPNWFASRESRGEVLGSYACAMLENGEVVCEPVSAEDLKLARAQNRGKSPAWDTWPDQQRQKVALKRLSKYLPKGDRRVDRALEIDEDPSTRPAIDVAGLDVTDEPSQPSQSSPLDQAVAQEQARAAAPDASPPQRLDRDRLFELLCDADEQWLNHRAIVDAWDEIDALGVLAFLRAVLGGDMTAPVPECMHLPKREVA
jgi:recombination protein RecT